MALFQIKHTERDTFWHCYAIVDALPVYEWLNLRSAAAQWSEVEKDSFTLPEFGMWISSYEVLESERLNWHARETGRLRDGTYTQLPCPWLPDVTTETMHHYAHVSMEDGAKIAFTENDAKGVRDIQTRMKPGKYLARFFGNASTTEQIAALSAAFNAKYDGDSALLFAVTADEIEHVYTQGPSSCMSHPRSHFQSPVHPVRVYAGHDLQLAYTKRDGRITARALCWPAEKIYGRVYGDGTRLCGLLSSAGYSEGSLAGAKITRLLCADGYVIPYLDYLEGAIDRNDHLELTDKHPRGLISGSMQCGVSEERSRYSCSCCETDLDEDDMTSHNGDYYCESCFSDRYSYCDHYGEYYDSDGFASVRVRHARAVGHYWIEENWCESAVEDSAFECPIDNHLYHNDLAVNMADGTQWGPQAFEDQGAVCAATDENYPADETVTLADGTTWCRAHFESHGVTIDGRLYDKDDAPNDDGILGYSPTCFSAAQIDLFEAAQALPSDMPSTIDCIMHTIAAYDAAERITL